MSVPEMYYGELAVVGTGENVEWAPTDLFSSEESDFSHQHLQSSIQKSNMPDNPETVCKDGEFNHMSEISVVVLLLGIVAGSRQRRD